MTPLLVRSFINEDWSCGKKRFLDPAWLAYRVDIYLHYTVPSLRQQTDTDFVTWLDCRPGSEQELKPHLARLEQAGVRISFDRGKQMLTRLEGNPSHFYLLRVDSDDCYAPEAVALVKQHQGEAIAAQFYAGYIWLAKPRVLWRMTHYSPPFYSLRLAINKDGLVWPSHAGHDSVRDTFQPVPLPDWQFCMIRHERHSAGAPLHKPTKNEWVRPNTPEWDTVMQKFAIKDSAHPS